MADKSVEVKNRSNITRKIALYASLGLIGALIVAIIVMASVRVNLFPFKKVNYLQGASEVIVYDGTREVGNFSENATGVSEFANIFKSSFKTSFLNAATNGYSSNKFTVDRISGTTVSSVASDSLFTIHYIFSEPKYIYENDGTIYTFNDIEQKAYSVVISVKGTRNEDGDLETISFGEVEIYFCTSVTNRTDLSTKLTGYANYNNLAKALEEFCEATRV